MSDGLSKYVVTLTYFMWYANYMQICYLYGICIRDEHKHKRHVHAKTTYVCL